MQNWKKLLSLLLVLTMLVGMTPAVFAAEEEPAGEPEEQTEDILIDEVAEPAVPAEPETPEAPEEPAPAKEAEEQPEPAPEEAKEGGGDQEAPAEENEAEHVDDSEAEWRETVAMRAAALRSALEYILPMEG
jgi:outer membrane biosynthesis protein TonB